MVRLGRKGRIEAKRAGTQRNHNTQRRRRERCLRKIARATHIASISRQIALI